MTKAQAGKEKGVIYARYSYSGQREESIEGQVRDCKQYAKQCGIDIVGIYTDRAQTATTDRREGFQRMIRDSAKGLFSVVIAWKHDRFARNEDDFPIYRAQLRRNGVRLLYAMEPVAEGASGVLTEGLLVSIAAWYSKDLSEKVLRGNRESALKYQTLGVRVLGLKEGPDKRYVIDPETAPIVQRIFSEYSSGRRSADICAGLNADGYRTRDGGPFNKNSIRRLLQNEKYIGIYEHSGVRAEGVIPAIVDKKTFDRCQELLGTHHKKPNVKKADGGYLLTGKIFCGECLEHMVSGSGTGKSGKEYQYYICKNRKSKRCKKARVSKERIEEIVLRYLVDLINNEEILERYANAIIEEQNNAASDEPAAVLRAELRDVDKSIKNNLKVIDSGYFSASVAEHLAQLERRKAELEDAIIAADLKASEKYEKEDILFAFKLLSEGDINDPAFAVYLIESFLRAVYVYDDGRIYIITDYAKKAITSDDILKETLDFQGAGPCSTFAPLGTPNGAKSNIYYKKGYLIGLIREIKKAREYEVNPFR